ncbi:MAG: bifunctional 5,10-methylenetetrahydrofolate dehydrogenase/5,10-methenyltetrahydrofolate cyclohydrolase [Gemmatimonadota bacterium]
MTAKIIDGNAMGEDVRAEVRREVEGLRARGVIPGLAVVLVGDDPASEVYEDRKGVAARRAGFHSRILFLPADTPQARLEEAIDELNDDPSIHGFLVQLPLPPQIDEQAVMWRVRPEKDVDGFHPVNVGRLSVGDPEAFRPATPTAVIEILLRSGVETAGQRVVIVGRSNIVGRPLAMMLSQKGRGGDGTVTIAHSKTRELPQVTREADILIAAAGRVNLITKEMVKPGAVVIDVGINRADDPSAKRGYRLVGDVAFDAVKEVASAITPVPGGVGPMTIAMLLRNAVQAATRITGVPVA